MTQCLFIFLMFEFRMPGMVDVVHICVAMKPVKGTLAQNALEYGVAGINVEGCRVEFMSVGDERHTKERQSKERGGFHGENTGKYGTGEQVGFDQSGNGRWPANVIFEHHSECVLKGMKEVASEERVEDWDCEEGCPVRNLDEVSLSGFGDKGGASRFFKVIGDEE